MFRVKYMQVFYLLIVMNETLCQVKNTSHVWQSYTVIPCSEISDNTFQHVENIFNKSLCKQL